MYPLPLFSRTQLFRQSLVDQTKAKNASAREGRGAVSVRQGSHQREVHSLGNTLVAMHASVANTLLWREIHVSRVLQASPRGSGAQCVKTVLLANIRWNCLPTLTHSAETARVTHMSMVRGRRAASHVPPTPNPHQAAMKFQTVCASRAGGAKAASAGPVLLVPSKTLWATI